MKSQVQKFTLLIALILLLNNCKKNHTCICSSKYSDSGGIVIKDKKQNAKKKCKEFETNGKYGGPTEEGCELEK